MTARRPAPRRKVSHWTQTLTPPTLSTPEGKRICAEGPDAGRAYCGRSKAPRVPVPADAAKVTCSDCVAAARADLAAR